MTWRRLVTKMLFFKPLGNVLSIFLLAAGVGIIALVNSLGSALDASFKNNIRGFDMVVGAKGSPLQLILSAVYHIDAPTGNIPLNEAAELATNPMVATAIPLSFGDNFNGYRIVGTEHDYPAHYNTNIQEGNLWTKSMEVVLGATVANRTGLKLGDTFFGSHGLADDMHVHDNAPYTVVGILAASNTVVDQLILTSLESVWDIHSEHHHEEEGHEAHDHEAHDHEAHDHEAHDHEAHDHEAHDHEAHDHEAHNDDRSITALLIKFRNPMAIMQLPRYVNSQTSMQAALPAIEINRLFGLLGIGIDTLRIVALFLMALSAFSVFTSLYNTLKDNILELAIIRAMGAGRWRIFGLLQRMAFIISGLGLMVGFGLAFLGKYLLSNYAQEALLENHTYWDLVKDNYLLLPLIFGLTFAAGLIPAIQAFRMNISNILARES
jgi:putative ABC transport system permease protein